MNRQIHKVSAFTVFIFWFRDWAQRKNTHSISFELMINTMWLKPQGEETKLGQYYGGGAGGGWYLPQEPTLTSPGREG